MDVRPALHCQGWPGWRQHVSNFKLAGSARVLGGLFGARWWQVGKEEDDMDETVHHTKKEKENTMCCLAPQFKTS